MRSVKYNPKKNIIGLSERGDPVSKVRQVLYLVLECCIFVVLAIVPGVFALQKNVFRQLPLYRFLEGQAVEDLQRQDQETYEKLVESNTRYLGKMVREENKDARVTPGITKTPQITESVKNELEMTEAPKPGQDNTRAAVTEPPAEEETATAAAQVVPVPEIDLAPEKLADYDYLMNHFFIVDSATETTAEQINAASFLAEDLTLQKETEAPQILIYHSHSQETFCDSREGKEEDTIVGVGDYLTELLSETYGYQVMHVTEKFDLAGGELDRSKAYDYARAWLEPVLKENPSIQVVIDLHRDGVPDDRRLVTEINGKETAQLLFYNGLSHTINSGDLSYLPNPYIQDNLAFSFQLEYQAALYYPELYRGIHLAGLRYNLHLRPRALLLEAGAQTNTVQEVKNAMEPFADILDRVLQGK